MHYQKQADQVETLGRPVRLREAIPFPEEAELARWLQTFARSATSAPSSPTSRLSGKGRGRSAPHMSSRQISRATGLTRASASCLMTHR